MAKKDINNKEKNNNFGKELKSELKKVSWPTFKQLVNNTSAVIAIVIIVAAIVFVLDVCFENLNDLGVGKIKTLVSTEESESDTETEEDSTDLGDGIELTTDDTTDSEETTETTEQVTEEGTEQEVQTEENSETEVEQ